MTQITAANAAAKRPAKAAARATSTRALQGRAQCPLDQGLVHLQPVHRPLRPHLGCEKGSNS
jgi:hypothetical protein